MGVLARWCVAAAGSFGAFFAAWWVCQGLLHHDEGVSLGIAAAVMAVVLTVTGWWAAREKPAAGTGDGGYHVVQKVRGKNVKVAGRDMTINQYGRKDD